MIDDSIRTHLVTKFKCSRCSRLLKLSTAASGHLDDDKRMAISNYSDDQPSGVVAFENHIVIHPCECTLRDRDRLNTLREILK